MTPGKGHCRDFLPGPGGPILQDPSWIPAGSQQDLTFQLLLLIVDVDDVARPALVNHGLLVVSLTRRRENFGAESVELPSPALSIHHSMRITASPPGTAQKTRTCGRFFCHSQINPSLLYTMGHWKGYCGGRGTSDPNLGFPDLKIPNRLLRFCGFFL